MHSLTKSSCCCFRTSKSSGFSVKFRLITLSQRNGQTVVPQSEYSVGKCSDSRKKSVCLFVFLVNTGNTKTRLGGGPQMTHRKKSGLSVPEGTRGRSHSCSCSTNWVSLYCDCLLCSLLYPRNASKIPRTGRMSKDTKQSSQTLRLLWVVPNFKLGEAEP